MKLTHICSKCKIEKPSTDFYTDNSSLGHACWCKECAKAHVRSKTLPIPCPHCGTLFKRHTSQSYCWIECALWDRVAKGLPDDCWEWTGSKQAYGYGVFTYDNKKYASHRVALTFSVGASELQALHSCDNPACCNPDHLRWGTQQDNMDDLWSRGRKVSPNRTGHWKAQFTEQQVAEIKEKLGKKRQIDIANEYGVKRSTIADISAGRSWRNK